MEGIPCRRKFALSSALSDSAVTNARIDALPDESGFVRQELFEQRRRAERRAIGRAEAQPVHRRIVASDLVGPIPIVRLADSIGPHRLDARDARRAIERQILCAREVAEKRDLDLAERFLGRFVASGDARRRAQPKIVLEVSDPLPRPERRGSQSRRHWAPSANFSAPAGSWKASPPTEASNVSCL